MFNVKLAKRGSGLGITITGKEDIVFYRIAALEEDIMLLRILDLFMVFAMKRLKLIAQSELGVTSSTKYCGLWA